MAYVAFISHLAHAYNRGILRGVSLFANTHRPWQLRVFDPKTMADFANCAGPECKGIIFGFHVLENLGFETANLPAVSARAHLADYPMPRITTDDVAVGRLVADYFIEHGYRSFGFVHAPAAFSVLRYNGFRDRVAEQFGNKVKPIPACEVEFDLPCIETIQAYVRTRDLPLAIMAARDEIAANVVSAVQAMGLRVPEDVSIVGVDNDDLYVETSDPPLSSVVQQNARVGYVAAEKLTELMNGIEVPHVTHIAPGQLVTRRSSDSMAITNRLVLDAMAYVQQHLADGVQIKELLEALCVSKKTLELHFARALGRSPAQEIRRKRIALAEQLLATSELSIAQVARQTGFSSARQFTKTFHNSTGVTPTAYRGQHRFEMLV